MRHHIIISGTGRSGTTFLMQLFTALGFDTGFTSLDSHVNQNCHAGMELDIRSADAPYVIKNPWLCDQLDEILAEGQVVIDHALIPVRDLYAAAESRRDVVRRTDANTTAPDQVLGGLWHTRRPEDQEAVLTSQLYKLIVALARYDVPTTLLFFPRLVNDSKYLYKTLRPVLGQLDYTSFIGPFQAASRPELVHDFGVPNWTK